LTWTSNRTASKSSQLFTATWDHLRARQALEIDSNDTDVALVESSMESDRIAGGEAARATAADFTAADIGRHVDYLCRPELGGRLTGTPGEAKATAYVASYLEGLGLEPAGVDGNWYQSFPFTAGVTLGEANRLTCGETTWKLNDEWRPVSFSRQGEVANAPVVFAGYGIVAPEDEGQPGYDSYVHLDVEGKWVIVYRQMPMDVTPERRQHLARYSGLRYKAMAARDRGAVGLIVVSGPTSGIREPLVPLQMDGTLAGSSLAVVSVSDSVAETLLKAGKSEESLEAMQKFLDRGELMMGFPLEGVSLAASIDVQQIKKEGRNVLGWLRAGSQPSSHVVVVGAHIDHLGTGQGGSSLARDEERGGTHRGADDNASGVAGMLEIAQFLAAQKRSGKLSLKHDILFAAWSGEELGLLGSDYFAEQFDGLYPGLRQEESGERDSAEASEGDGHGHGAAVPTGAGAVRLAPTVAACFNLDMIGRLREKLVLQGVGSSPVWTQEIEQRNAVVGLSLTLQSDSYLPTDASTFFMAGVPILSAFTGSHGEYHTPRDTPDLINYEGAAQVARLMGLIARSISTRPEPPEYVAQAAPENQGKRAMLTAFLGTVPDYAQGDIQGVKLSGVAKNGPAATAGVQGGDVIVELAGKKIENVYDYTFAIEGLRVGQETEIVVQRGDKTLRLKVIPASRQ
jgi:Zn-dependent M28 family amino/carboxypeptidase